MDDFQKGDFCPPVRLSSSPLRSIVLREENVARLGGLLGNLSDSLKRIPDCAFDQTGKQTR